MKPLFERNPHWAIHLEGNDEKDAFMNTTFANTSLLWAYHMIHPQCGAAKADLWRYVLMSYAVWLEDYYSILLLPYSITTGELGSPDILSYSI